jgi:alkylhydroperoxidase family enzyme
VLATGGHVSDVESQEIHDAGFTDAAIVEIAAVVAANVFANLVNNLAESVPDALAIPPPTAAGV